MKTEKTKWIFNIYINKPSTLFSAKYFCQRLVQGVSMKNSPYCFQRTSKRFGHSRQRPHQTQILSRSASSSDGTRRNSSLQLAHECDLQCFGLQSQCNREQKITSSQILRRRACTIAQKARPMVNISSSIRKNLNERKKKTE